MPDILSIQGLKKVYRHGRQEVVAVDGVSLGAGAGEVVGLLGPNGAGKTTTIKCVLGLLEPTAGEVRVVGFDVRRQRGRALAHVGAVLEGSRNVYWQLTPPENLVLFGNLAGLPTPVARRRAGALLERFGLQERSGSRVGELSRGMQQKVALCAALIREPQLLLLDEPTLGLDVETAAQLRELLLGLAREQGRAVVVSSHQMGLIEAICERVVVLRQGRVIAQERVDRLLALFASRAFLFRTEQPIPVNAVECLHTRFPTAQLQGDGMSVAVTFDYDEQLYEAIDILRAGGCVLHSVEHQAPDLEAVFLHLIRAEGGTA